MAELAVEEVLGEERARMRAAAAESDGSSLVPHDVHRFVAPYLRGAIVSVGFRDRSGVWLPHPVFIRLWCAPDRAPEPLPKDLAEASALAARVPQQIDASCAVDYVTLLVQLTSRTHATVEDERRAVEPSDEATWRVTLSVLEQKGRAWTRSRRRLSVAATGLVAIVDDHPTDPNVDRGFTFGR